MARAIGDFAIACLRKIPMLGAVSQKVGFACVQALGTMESNEAISQLARLRARVKYKVALKLIEKCLREAADRSGLTVSDLEDLATPSYPLDVEGKTEITVGDASATVHLSEDGEVGIIWRNAEGKLVKAPPSHLKKTLPKEVKSVAALAKELGEVYRTQRYRLESSFVESRSMSLAHWRKYFIEHSLLGLMGRRLIWVFSNEHGWERSGLYVNGDLCDSRGETFDVGEATKVRLWHPLSSEPHELQQWRERVFNQRLRQPFRQAFREIYQIMEGERQTRMYSNRFAGMVMR
jgi:hypothetical protein